FREREITLYFNLSRGHGHLTEGTTRVTLPYPNAEVPHLGVQWRWQYIGREFIKVSRSDTIRSHQIGEGGWVRGEAACGLPVENSRWQSRSS
ncbi:unnamed protein product, partial [Ascophyllum nodosum]